MLHNDVKVVSDYAFMLEIAYTCVCSQQIVYRTLYIFVSVMILLLFPLVLTLPEKGTNQSVSRNGRS